MLAHDSDAAEQVAHTGRRRHLSNVAASHIRDLVVSGEISGGEYLRPAQLAAQLGISITPVREALLMLCAENFVALEPQRGFVAVPLTRDDILDLFHAQGLIAGELAARAAGMAGEPALRELRRMQDELEAAARVGANNDVEQINFEFHRFINKLPGAPKLEWVLRTFVRYTPRRYFANIEGWRSASVRDHHDILDALASADPEQARAAAQTHVRHAGELLVEHFSRRAAWTAGPSPEPGP
ncbi:GntR family transcriptional regulator [Dactylosporangium sp. CA-092794]|uniref:GntR family transcriptional regulator n=1 Tax=Dactylosporangium sp. CA-092794 TaxID=3239929 RepID=UPI003D93C744